MQSAQTPSSTDAIARWNLAFQALAEDHKYDLQHFQQPLPVEGRSPDFLIIGAQRAGTTWLHRNLGYCPEVWMPLVKEIHYFTEKYVPSNDRWERLSRQRQIQGARDTFSSLTLDEAVLARHTACLAHLETDALSDDWYRKIFSFGGSGQVVGESSPYYCLLPRQVVSVIGSQNPRLRVIMLLRDPIDRAWSSMQLRAAAAGRSGQGILTKFSEEQSWIYLAASNYPIMLRHWKFAFPSEQMLLLNHDDIHTEPESVIRKTCEFLSIKYDQRFFPEVREQINEGTKMRIPAEIYTGLKRLTKGIYDELVELLPKMAHPWRARHFGNAA